MANINEESKWENAIYQLETTDKVLGGENGISNLQAKQLANRTNFLNNRINNLGYDYVLTTQQEVFDFIYLCKKIYDEELFSDINKDKIITLNVLFNCEEEVFLDEIELSKCIPNAFFIFGNIYSTTGENIITVHINYFFSKILIVNQLIFNYTLFKNIPTYTYLSVLTNAKIKINSRSTSLFTCFNCEKIINCDIFFIFSGIIESENSFIYCSYLVNNKINGVIFSMENPNKSQSLVNSSTNNVFSSFCINNFFNIIFGSFESTVETNNFSLINGYEIVQNNIIQYEFRKSSGGGIYFYIGNNSVRSSVIFNCQNVSNNIIKIYINFADSTITKINIIGFSKICVGNYLYINNNVNFNFSTIITFLQSCYRCMYNRINKIISNQITLFPVNTTEENLMAYSSYNKNSTYKVNNTLNGGWNGTDI